ncbi:heterokaryon incompatibility protein-domain-containing protein [Xylaria scruposa]|nr:heterokaryon incompatibility protein-domain-containing protein [Xylaria scruposa]
MQKIFNAIRHPRMRASISNDEAKKPNTQSTGEHRPEPRRPKLREEGLCDACKAVPWISLAKNIPAMGDPRLVLRITASHDELRGSICKICRALSSIKPPRYDGLPNGCSIRAYRSTELLQSSGDKACTVLAPYRFSYNEYGYLSVVEGHSNDFDINPQKIDHQRINYDYFRERIAYCTDKHKECRPKLRASSIPGLRVFDCQTRSVVIAPDSCKYIALSYVWGDLQNDVFDGTDSNSIPRTVLDSMTVSLELGCRYLWVDRYCISQDKDDRQHMINQMADIYANAYLTIIAAAGEDATYGLPGVGQTRRKQQVEVSLQGFTLRQGYPHGHWVLEESKWAKRGWTYQEGFLSFRRLVFTDQEVFFVCHSWYAAESVKEPPDRIPGNYFGFGDIFPSSSNKKSPSNPRTLWTHIEEYTRRSLTYGSDSLRAFSAILSHYEVQGPLYNICGLPFYNDAKGPMLDLLWFHDDPTRRRVCIPSWSWAGWAGAVISPSRGITQRDIPDISVHYSRDLKIPLRELYGSSMSSDLQNPNRLSITCPCTLVQLKKTSLLDRESYFDSSYALEANDITAKLKVSDDITVIMIPYLDEPISIDGNALGLVFSLWVGVSDPGYAILIVKPVDDHYERVGIIFMVAGDRMRICYLNRQGEKIKNQGLVLNYDQQLWRKRSVTRTICLG